MFDTLKQQLRTEEGNIPWMYRDSRGYVTTGVGHLLSTSEPAVDLPWRQGSNGPLVGPIAIRAEYAKVLELSPNEVAEYYRERTALRLSQEAIDGLLDKDVFAVAVILGHSFSGWNQFPETAQEALLDLTFEVGASGLVDGFPKLCEAAVAQEWGICAMNCHVVGCSDSRNEVRADLFRQAALLFATAK